MIGCLHAKAFPWSVVEFVHDVVKILLGDGREITALRKILANEAIGVFVEAPLPGGVRMSKIKIGIEGLGDGFVLGKLFSVVSREGMDVLRQGRQKFQDGMSDALSFLIGHLCDQRQA